MGPGLVRATQFKIGTSFVNPQCLGIDAPRAGRNGKPAGVCPLMLRHERRAARRMLTANRFKGLEPSIENDNGEARWRQTRTDRPLSATRTGDFGRFLFPGVVFRVNGSVDFASMNGDFFRGFDAQAHLVTADLDNRDHDVLVDHNAFIFLARKNQHCTQLSQGVAGLAHRGGQSARSGFLSEFPERGITARSHPDRHAGAFDWQADSTRRAETASSSRAKQEPYATMTFVVRASQSSQLTEGAVAISVHDKTVYNRKQTMAVTRYP